MYYGTHVSIKKGISTTPALATEMKQTTFQMYTRSPRAWKTKKLTKETCEKFQSEKKKHNFKRVVVHMPYLPNLSSDAVKTSELSLEVLMQEVARCDMLGVDYLVLHCGSHKGKGLKSGLAKITEHLTIACAQAKKVTLLLENSAGSKNSVGSKFDELAEIIQRVNSRKLQICLDTCHTHAAGYNLSEGNALNTLDTINESVGLNKVQVVHINDAKGEVGSLKDRHEHIGQGTIGMEGFIQFFTHKSITSRKLPLILETPINELGDDHRNLRVLREVVASANSRT